MSPAPAPRHSPLPLLPRESVRTLANLVTVVRTILGIGFGVIALAQHSLGWLVAAYLTYWAGDILDGIVARRRGEETIIGAVFDVVCDRACTTVAAAAFVGLVLGDVTTGIILGVFFLGLFAPRVGQRAALAAFVLGLLGMTVVYFTTSLAWPWYSLFGSLGTFGLGLLASAVWPREGPAAVVAKR